MNEDQNVEEVEGDVNAMDAEQSAAWREVVRDTAGQVIALTRMYLLYLYLYLYLKLGYEIVVRWLLMP